MGLKLLLLLAFVAYTTAGPITKNSETCSRTCTDSKKFGYVAGKTYEYDYTTDIDTSVQGASEEKSGVQMTAKVFIDVVSKCEMNLRLDSVRLREADPNDPSTMGEADTNGDFRTSLEESPLAFSFQDGRIEELCTSKPEQTWVLNIKRGILSSLQNAMNDLTQDQTIQESDVTGECEAEYKVTNSGWYTKTIKKSKNLLACTDRHGFNTVMQGTPYRVPSEIQSLPLVKSNHECTQEVSNTGILQSSVCEEQHVLRPFSRESSGAVTKTRQSLKYVSETSKVHRAVQVLERLPLTFAHSNNGKGSTNDVMNKLTEICSSTEKKVQPDTPRLFTDLVRVMKALSGDDLRQIHKKILKSTFCPTNNQRVVKCFRDALPMIGTPASLRMMTSLIVGKEVTGMEADMWLTTLSFIKDPTKDMLNEVKTLLTSDVYEKAILGVSSLVNGYCKKVSCENDLDIAGIVSSIEDKIGVGCFVDKNNLNKVILSLRSLGNAGYIHNALTTINTCITKKDNPTEVRLAAIEAFRRTPCSVDRTEVMTVFRNKEEDSELRIASYLALMTCPSDVTLSRVRFVLESEEVNQVGSFVWSHLTNLMETSSPLKQSIRNIVSDEELKKEFDLEKLKYSRNYEASFFLEKLNTGASMDSNLIWSSKSFLPRSAMTNITFDLFGHSVNLLEIGGRVEGLEYFLESYFGPNGYFQEKNEKETTKQALKGISDTKMEDIDRQFGSEMDALRGNMYMRVFGNELMFTRFTGLSDIRDGKSINILDIVTSLANNRRYSFTQNIMFLDSSIIIPTISGLPMNLTIDGSATIDMEAAGKIDLRKLTSNPPSLSVNGYIKPSGSVQINSMMSVDAFVTKSGMKMVSTMHSSSSLEGHIELDNGKVLSAEIKTPFDQMEVFNIRTAFFTVHRDSEREQKMVTKNRQIKKVCSGDKLAKITGMELCAELQYPNASLQTDAPYFPMTGPVSAGIILYKRDSHASYNFEYKFAKENREARARVAFSTPGSSIDRALNFDCLLRPEDPVLEISMMSPWKKASFRGAFVTDNKQKQITGRIVIDNTNEYSVTAVWSQTKDGQSLTFNPYIEIVIPNKENIRLSSTVQYVIGKSFDGEIIVKGLSRQPIQSKVNLLNKRGMTSLKTSISFEAGKEYSFETRLQTTDTKKATKLIPFLSIRTPIDEVAAFGGSLEYKPGTLILIDLTLDRLLDQTVKIYTKLLKTERKANSRFQSKIDINTPFLRTKGTSNIMIQNAAIVTRVNLDYVIPTISRDRININSKVNYVFTQTVWSLKGDCSVDFKRNSDYNVVIKTDLSNKERLTNVECDVRYGAKKKDENKRIYITSLVRHELDWKASDLDINAEVQHLAMGVDFKIKGSHSHKPKSIDSSIGIVYGKKQSVSAALQLKNKSKRFTALSGDASIKWNEKEFSISDSFEQKNAKKFTNELSTNIAGRKTSIISDLKISDDEYDVSTDINMPEREPVHMEAQMNMNPRDFRIRSQLNKDYTVTFSSLFKGGVLQLGGDISFPSRRVTGLVEAKKKDPVYRCLVDIKWDANADKEKQLLFETELEFRKPNDITGSLMIKSPLQNNKININRKDKIAHFDIRSFDKEQIAVDTYLEQKNDHQILSSLTLQTTHRELRYMKIEVDHLSNDNQVKTNIDINWKPTNKVSAVLSLRKPLNLRTIHGSFNIKTPINTLGSLSFEIDHDLKDELKSALNGKLNDQFIQFDGSAKKDNDVYVGHAAVKSNVPSVKSISLDVSHQTREKINTNSIVLDVNGKIYKYEGELTHDRSGVMIQQKGRILLITPTNQYDTTWRHSNTLNDVSTVVTSKIDKDLYSLSLNGKHNVAWQKASVQYTLDTVSPSGKGQLVIDHRHTQNDGTFVSIVKIRQNDQDFFSTDYHMLVQNGELSFNGNLQINSKQLMTIETNFKSGTVKSLRLLVSTPLSSLRKISAEAEFSGNLQSMTSSASIEVEPILAKMQLLTSFNRLGGVSGNIRLVRPSQYSEVTFSQRPEEDKTRTDIKLEYLPGNVLSMTLKTLFKIPRVEVDVKFTTPYENFRSFIAGFNNNITPKGYLTKLQMEYPEGKIYSAEMNNEFEKNYLSSTTVRLPDSHPITFQVNHKGTLNQFSCGCMLQYNRDEKHEVDLRFTNGERMHGLFNLKSPSTKNIMASFKHIANDMDIQTDAEIQYGENKPITVNIEMSNSKRMKGTLKVTSPFMDDINVLLTNKGKPNNFKAKAKFGWGKQEIEGDLSFSFTSNLNADFSVSTPFKSLKKITALLTHEGNLKNFKCYSELKIGKDLWSANLKSKLDPTISTELMIQTPYDEYENLRAAYKHDGILSDFICHLELSQNKKIAVGDLQFSAQPLTLSASLQTPFANYRNLKAAVSHNGSLRKFVTKSEITYEDSKTITFDTSVNTESPITASVNMKTPFIGYEELIVNFAHSGPVNNFASKLEAIVNKERSQLDVSFTTLDKIDGKLTLQSPYYDLVKIAISHNLEPSFNTKALVSYGGKSILDSQVSFVRKPTLKVSVALQTSFAPSITGSFEHAGDLLKCKTNMRGEFGQNSVEGDLDLDAKKDLSVIMNLYSTFDILRSGKVAISHKRQLRDFESRADVEINSKKAQGVVQLSSTNGVQVSAKMTTTFANIHNVEVSYRHEGSIDNFVCNFDFVHDGKKTEGQLAIRTTSGLNARGYLKSPYFDDIAFKLNHDGELRRFNSRGEMSFGYKAASAELSVNTDSVLKIDGILKTPFTDDIVLKTESTLDSYNVKSSFKLTYSGRTQHEVELDFRQKGTLKEFSTSSDVTYNKKKTSILVKFDSNNGIEGMVTIKTPLSEDIILYIKQDGQPLNFKAESYITYSGRTQHKAAIVFSHEGSYKKFYTRSEASYNNKRVAASMSFDATNSIQVTATLETPLTKMTMISLSHTGELRDFSSLLNIEYGGSKVHTFSLIYKYDGELRKFTSSGTLSYNGRKISTDVSFDTLRDPEGSISIRTPYTDDITASFNHQGVMDNFLSHGEVGYGDLKHEVNIALQNYNHRKFAEVDYNKRKVSIEATLQRDKGIIGRLVVKTPFTDDILLTVEHNGDPLNFNTKGDVSYSGRLQHSISVVFEHRGGIDNFNSKGEATYNNKKISSKVEFDSTSGVKAKGIFRSPWISDIEILLEHQGRRSNFNSHAVITYSGSKQHEVSIQFKHDGTLRTFKTSADVNYNLQRTSFIADIDTISRLSVNLLLQTPHWSDMKANIAVNGDVRNFDYQADLTYSGQKQHSAKGSLNIDGDLRRFTASGKASYNDKEISTDISLDTTNNIQGQLTLKTPFTEDIILSITHKGSMKEFESRVQFNYFGQKQHDVRGKFSLTGSLKSFVISSAFSYNNNEISTDIALDANNGIDGKATLKTPYTDDITVLIKHRGNIFDFDTRAEFSYGGNKMQEVTCTMKQTGNMNNFRLFNSITYNGKAVSLDVNTNVNSGLECSVEIRSPIKDLKASVSHKIDSNLNTYRTVTKLMLNDKEIIGESQVDLTSGFRGKVTLQTPFTNFERHEVTALFTNDNGLIVMEGKVTSGQFKSSMNTKIDTTTGIKVENCIKTPFTKDFEILFNGNRASDMFRYDYSIGYGSDKVKGFVNHEWSLRTIKGELLLATPILEDIKVEYDITGSLKSFESSIKASVGDMNEVKEVTRFSIGDSILDLDTTVTTTITGYKRSSQLTISHNGGLSKFKTTIRALTGKQEIKIDTSFKQFPSIEGHFSLQSPFAKFRDVNAKLEHTGRLEAFTTKSSIQYAPNKVIEGILRVDLQSLERAYLKTEIKSPCPVVPHFTWGYSHDMRSDSLSSSTYMTTSPDNQVFKGNLQLSKETITFSLETPTKIYSVNGNIKINGDSYSLTGNAASNSDKITLNIELTPVSITANLETPFRGIESTRLRASASKTPYSAALNIQTSLMSDFDFEARFNGRRLTELEGSLKLISGVTYLQDIRISMKNTETSNEAKAHIEAFFNQPEGLIMDGSVSNTEAILSLRTPFNFVRTLDSTIRYQRIDTEKRFISSTNLELNQVIMYDVDFEFSSKDLKEISLTAVVKQPKQMRFEINKLGTAETYIIANWNNNDRDSSCRLDAKFNDDWSVKKQIVHFGGMCGSSNYGLDASYERPERSAKYAIFVSKDNIKTHGFEIEESIQENRFKLKLPTRTMVFSNSKNSEYESSSFFWDADNDQDKRITVKTTNLSRRDANEFNLELEMPSIRKELRVDTKMRTGGNVIYDGSAEIKYSKDARKTLTLSSKLEDVSGRGEKYNFLLGINHPYTTVDIQTKAEFGKSDDKLSAGIDIRYMTAKRQTKNFALMTEIDRLRRQLNFHIRSPVKSMKMDAGIDTSPFKLTIRNLYDDVNPINTDLIVDPDQASIDFSMNYDIDDPKRILHVNAKFSDEKGISAEISRDENNRKIVDSLLNLRLKTSKILNTRVQWRPDLIRDVKERLSRRTEKYGEESGLVLAEASDEINKEISYKARIIQAAYNEEVKPLADMIRELRQLRQTNEYYLGDIFDSAEVAVNRIMELYKDLDETWNSSPMKQKIDELIERLYQLEQELEDYSTNVYINMGDQMNTIRSSSFQKFNDALNAVENQQTVRMWKSKYQSYIDQFQKLNVNDQISNIANQYTSTIYNARESINNKLANSLPTNVYTLGSSAYKSWEIEENIKSYLEKIVEEIKKGLEKELSALRDIYKNVLKSKVVAYDLTKGEIEVDIYLPVDVQTLSSISEISLRKYIPDMKPLIPKVNWIGSLEDYMPHMSWTGRAKIRGERFTTFDGQNFDFSGRCSYVLARDYMDGNFSIILNYLGRQKRRLIMTSHQQNVQLVPGGKVRVDGVVMDLPYKSSEIEIFDEADKVVVKGRGFQVRSDRNVDAVDIDLSGWYFGRTGGLLGTLNNERYDDMIMPNKQITSDPDTLATAWQVAERCR